MTARGSSQIRSTGSSRGSSSRGRQSQPDRQTLEQATLDRLQAVHDILTRAVADLAQSDAWQRMLRTAARFHHYSPHNVLLITAQCPQAEAVAGYQTWKQLDRQVRKGEKGIAILAPVVRRRSLEVAPTGSDGPDGGGVDPALRTLGTTEGTGRPAESTHSPGTDPQVKARRLAGFRVVHVFDINQTDGPPLPTHPLPELLAGEAPEGLLDALTVHVTNAGYRLAFEELSVPNPGLAGANGVTDYLSRTVTVRSDLSPAQTVKTLAHELGHVLLHGPEQRPATLTREQAEVEAESVAYVIGAAHGLDTSSYTIPYVAGWASADLDLIRGTAERVLSTARQVLATAPPSPAFEMHDRSDGSRTLEPAPRTPVLAVLDGAERPITRQDTPSRDTADKDTADENTADRDTTEQPRRPVGDRTNRTASVADATDLNALDHRAVDVSAFDQSNVDLSTVDLGAVDVRPLAVRSVEKSSADQTNRLGQQLLFLCDPEPGGPVDGREWRAER